MSFSLKVFYLLTIFILCVGGIEVLHAATTAERETLKGLKGSRVFVIDIHNELKRDGVILRSNGNPLLSEAEVSNTDSSALLVVTVCRYNTTVPAPNEGNRTGKAAYRSRKL
jgi:hypothetical protein